MTRNHVQMKNIDFPGENIEKATPLEKYPCCKEQCL